MHADCAASDRMPTAGASSADNFRARLNEINEEMKAIISKGELDRAYIDRYHRPGHDGSASLQSPLTVDTGASAAAAMMAVSRSPPSVSDPIRREVRAAFASEMSGITETIRELVAQEWDTRMQELDTVLRNRFAALKKGNDGIGVVVMELSVAVGQSHEEMRSVVNRVEADLKKSIVKLEGKVAELEHGNGLKEHEARDALAELQFTLRSDSRRADRRVDELIKRHHELLQESFVALDTRVAKVRDEMVELLRSQSRKQSEELDETQRIVAGLHGMVAASCDACARWVTDLREVMEEGVEQRSELRSCRRDVNRLDMLLQALGCPSGSPGPEAKSGGAHGAAAGTPALHDLRTVGRAIPDTSSWQPTVRLEEFLDVRDKVIYLLRALDRLERRVLSLDPLLRRENASITGGKMPSANRQSCGGVPQYNPHFRDFHDTTRSQQSYHAHSHHQQMQPNQAHQQRYSQIPSPSHFGMQVASSHDGNQLPVHVMQGHIMPGSSSKTSGSNTPINALSRVGSASPFAIPRSTSSSMAIYAQPTESERLGTYAGEQQQGGRLEDKASGLPTARGWTTPQGYNATSATARSKTQPPGGGSDSGSESKSVLYAPPRSQAESSSQACREHQPPRGGPSSSDVSSTFRQHTTQAHPRPKHAESLHSGGQASSFKKEEKDLRSTSSSSKSLSSNHTTNEDKSNTPAKELSRSSTPDSYVSD